MSSYWVWGGSIMISYYNWIDATYLRCTFESGMCRPHPTAMQYSVYVSCKFMTYSSGSVTYWTYMFVRRGLLSCRKRRRKGRGWQSESPSRRYKVCSLYYRHRIIYTAIVTLNNPISCCMSKNRNFACGNVLSINSICMELQLGKYT